MSSKKKVQAIIKPKLKWSKTAGYTLIHHVYIRGFHSHEYCGCDYIEVKNRLILAEYEPIYKRLPYHT